MWRVGRKLGRTLYRDEVCVGMVDTPEIALAIVHAMNEREKMCSVCGKNPAAVCETCDEEAYYAGQSS